VEALASLDSLLEQDFFIGLEDYKRFATCVIGAKPGHWLPGKMLDWYDRTSFRQDAIKMLVNVNEVSRLLLERGFSGNGGDERLGGEYVLGIGRLSSAEDAPGIRNPLTRHWYAASWRERTDKRLRNRVWRRLKKVPEKIGIWCSLQAYRIKKWASLRR
jgi:hypothetical protein